MKRLIFIPEAFLPHLKLRRSDRPSLAPGEWPDYCYAGDKLARLHHKARQLPKVPEPVR